MYKKTEDILGYKFKNKDLLKEALIHKSKKIKDDTKNTISYERLEFFGDRILGFVIAEKVYKENQNSSEGDFNLIFQQYVNEKYLSKIALELGLNNYILTQEGDDLRLNSSILADVIESLIAAIYLDSDISECKKFINNKILKNALYLTKSTKHPKSFLQEYSLKFYKSIPEYSLIKKIGPDHNPNFRVSVNINGDFGTSAEGKNIQLAEENAAKKLLSIIENNKNK